MTDKIKIGDNRSTIGSAISPVYYDYSELISKLGLQDKLFGPDMKGPPSEIFVGVKVVADADNKNHLKFCAAAIDEAAEESVKVLLRTFSYGKQPAIITMHTTQQIP